MAYYLQAKEQKNQEVRSFSNAYCLLLLMFYNLQYKCSEVKLWCFYFFQAQRLVPLFSHLRQYEKEKTYPNHPVILQHPIQTKGHLKIYL